MKLARKLLRNILILIGFVLAVPGLFIWGLGLRVWPTGYDGVVPLGRR